MDSNDNDMEIKNIISNIAPSNKNYGNSNFFLNNSNFDISRKNSEIRIEENNI